MRGRRDKLELVHDSLEKCSNNGGIQKTDLMSRVGFTSEQMKKYLSLMLNAGVIEMRKNNENKTTYATTKKGSAFLNVYRTIEDMFI